MVSNGLPVPLLHETIWLEANRYQEAERQYYEIQNQSQHGTTSSAAGQHHTSQTSGMSKSSLASEIAHARQKIQNFLNKSGDAGISEVEKKASDVYDRIKVLEKERTELRKELTTLSSTLNEMCIKLANMELVLQKANLLPAAAQNEKKSVSTVQNGPAAKDDDDDIDLFGSDEETEEDIKLKEARVKAYADKKAKKPALIAKSSVVLDVKPWDDETDMKVMETAVRKIVQDGLVWGASKLVPLAYGIKKLQIVAIVEDEKVSVDWLQETIQDIEDLVQSVDIAAFNKL